MEDKRQRVFVRTPVRKWMLRGGLLASALPMLAGVAALFFGSGFLAPHYLLGVLIFIGTGVTLAIALPYVSRKNKSGFTGCWAFVRIGVASATLAHIVTTILFILYWRWVFSGFGMGIMFMRFLSSNVTTWMGITLPASAFCGWIFWYVAVRDTSKTRHSP